MGVEERAEKSSAKAAGSHKIIHIDMDALYASVEQHDNPEPRLLGGTEGSQTLPWREMDSNFLFRAKIYRQPAAWQHREKGPNVSFTSHPRLVPHHRRKPFARRSTLTPSRANSRAMALPIPRLPPVTIARLSCNPRSMSLLSLAA
jgi:hypothetical protein